MNGQPAKLLDMIVCDEVRREDNGKLLVIGMYLGKILVTAAPFRMPRLSLLFKWRTYGSAPAGDFRLTNPSKETLAGFGVKIRREPEPIAPVFYTTFSFENIALSETGTYSLEHKPPGGKRFRRISTFDVGLKEETS